MQAGLVLTQLLAALIVGLITAFAFQFLLTSFGVAIGLSAWGIQAARNQPIEPIEQTEEQPEQNLEQNSQAEANESSNPIGTIAGFGILLTVNIVLFGSCFLAAKFSQVNQPWLGAIEGIVIWSAYFLMLIWLSTNAVSSFVGTLFDVATGGLRRMITTIAAAFSHQDKPVSEAEMIAAIREEMQSAFNSDELRQMIIAAVPPRQPIAALNSKQDDKQLETETASFAENANHPAIVELWQKIAVYLEETSAKRLTRKRIDRKLQKILQQIRLELGEETALPHFDQAVIVQLLEQRQDLKSQQKERILDQIAETWKQVLEEPAPSIKSSANEPAQSSEETRSIAQTTADLWQSAKDMTVDRVLETLPNTLQKINQTLPTDVLAPLAVSVVKNKIQEAIDPTQAETSSGSSGFTDLSQIVTQVERWQARSIQQIDSIQQAAQARITELKQQTQQRMIETRKTAEAAAWWLFFTASTGAISAALAGAFATGLTLPH